MSSWSRRLEAADRRDAVSGPRPSEPTSSDPLAKAHEAGVGADDLAALSALVAVARDRVGFRTRLTVRGSAGGGATELDFEIAHAERGVDVRLVSTRHDEGDTDEGDADDGIVAVLTNTLVETPDLVAVFSSVGHEAIWANDAFATVIPVRVDDKVWLVELLDEWSKGHYEVKVLPALVKYGRWRGRLTLLTGAGERPVSAVIVAHRDRRGEIESVSMVARDTVSEPLDDAQVGEADARLAALVEHAADIIAVCAPDGTLRYASPAALRLLEVDAAHAVGLNVIDLVHPDDRVESLLELVRPDEQGVGVPVDVRLEIGGTSRYLEAIVTDLRDNPAIGGVVLNVRDVTERVQNTRTLTERAYTDSLTGLPNRVRLLDRLGTVLEAAEPVAVLLADLDRFDTINARHGTELGDAVVREIGRRLVDAGPAAGFIARASGDQFVAVAPGMGDRADAIRLANHLRGLIGEPVVVGDVRVVVSASVGVVVTDAALEPEDVLRDAGRALAQAKEVGRDRIEVFTAQLAESANRRTEVEGHLRHALDNDGVTVHYQPIVNVDGRTVVAVEALLRVQDEQGSLLSPAEFIEAAESSGLMSRLGGRVLQATADQLASWSGVPGTPQEISVNISPRQLADPNLPNLVVEALRVSGVWAGHLALEITESILISPGPTVDAAISYLRALGVRVGLDDFGAGKSSLGYLKRFPLDFVKIDRSLIAGLGIDDQDTAIVRATIDLAHNLGLQVIAVGVETEEQLEILELLGCERAQGYLFAPALPPGEVTGLVRRS